MNITHDHEQIRTTTMINKTEVLEMIKTHFSDALTGLKLRKKSEQTIVGDLLTSLELELKKEIKSLKSYERKDL